MQIQRYFWIPLSLPVSTCASSVKCVCMCESVCNWRCVSHRAVKSCEQLQLLQLLLSMTAVPTLQDPHSHTSLVFRVRDTFLYPVSQRPRCILFVTDIPGASHTSFESRFYSTYVKRSNTHLLQQLHWKTHTQRNYAGYELTCCPLKQTRGCNTHSHCLPAVSSGFGRWIPGCGPSPWFPHYTGHPAGGEHKYTHTHMCTYYTHITYTLYAY